MNTKKWFGVSMAAVMMGTLLAGCGSEGSNDNAGGSTADSTQELHLTMGDDLPTTDLAKAQDAYSFNVLSATMEGLVRLDKTGEATQGLASNWEVSADGLTYTFKLRDAKWSNGDAVTAKDFVYSWTRTLAPKSASQYSFMLGMIKGADEYTSGQGTAEQVGVKALDDKTLQVTLEAPTPYFLKQTSFPTFFPLNQKFVESKGDKFGTDLENTLAVGPFKLTTWEHDTLIAVEKNADYWDAAAVKLNKVTWNVVKDTNASLNMYEAGEIDRTGLVRDQVARYKDNKEEFHVTPELTNGYVMFNTKIKGLDNAKVRTALTWAIDRQKYADIIYGNGTKAATGFVPEGTSDSAGGDYRKTAGDLVGTHSEADAKTLLEAGLQEAGLTVADFKPRLLIDDSDVAKKAGEFLKEQWRAKLGLDVQLDSVPFKLRLQQEDKGEYNMTISLWGADYNDPMTFLDMWVSNGSQNKSFYANPEYDKLINMAKVEADAKKRAQYLVEAEKLLLKDMPVGPIFFRARAIAMKPYVKNFVAKSSGVDYELKWTYIEGK